MNESTSIQSGRQLSSERLSCVTTEESIAMNTTDCSPYIVPVSGYLKLHLFECSGSRVTVMFYMFFGVAGRGMPNGFCYFEHNFSGYPAMHG